MVKSGVMVSPGRGREHYLGSLHAMDAVACDGLSQPQYRHAGFQARGGPRPLWVLALSVSEQRNELVEHLINTFYAFYSIIG